MSLVSPSYYISIAGGPETPCETLGIDPLSIRRASMDIDYLEMEQHRKRGQWVQTLPHDADIRFYRYKPSTDNLFQLFMGRVISPQTASDSHSTRRIIRVAGVGQLLKQLRFHRGQFVPGRVGGPPQNPWEEVSRAVETNGDVVPLWWGAYLATDPRNPTTQIKLYRIQNVRQAASEVFLNLQYLLPWHGGITNVWSPTLKSLALGTNPPRPLPFDAGQNNYLDWLIRILQAVPDAFLRWDLSGARPEATIGRFGLQSPLTLNPGPPLATQFVERRQHEEALGLLVTLGSTSLTVAEFNRGYGNRVRWGHFPTSSPARNSLRRQTSVLHFGPESGGANLTPEGAQAIADYAGPFMTGPLLSGSLTFINAPDWCTPGTVFSLAGQRLNVQETIHNLATDQITAQVGVPRQLGVDDITGVGAWLANTLRAMPGVVTGG
jgi:hypothetical protein